MLMNLSSMAKYVNTQYNIHTDLLVCLKLRNVYIKLMT